MYGAPSGPVRGPVRDDPGHSLVRVRPGPCHYSPYLAPYGPVQIPNGFRTGLLIIRMRVDRPWQASRGGVLVTGAIPLAPSGSLSRLPLPSPLLATELVARSNRQAPQSSGIDIGRPPPDRSCAKLSTGWLSGRHVAVPSTRILAQYMLPCGAFRRRTVGSSCAGTSQ